MDKYHSIQWTVQSVFLILFRWIVIYPMDSAIQRLNKQGQVYNPGMDKHPIQWGIVILLGMLHAKETR